MFTAIKNALNSAVKGKVSEVIDADSGMYVVTLVSGSRYVLDLDNKVIVRHPEDESDWHFDLKRGNLNIINKVSRCVVGERCEIYLGTTDNLVMNTSPVVRIDRY